MTGLNTEKHMRALVMGSNAVLILNVVQALGAAGAEADVISDWHAPRVRYSRYCRRYIRVPRGSLHESLPGSVDWRLEQYCRDNDISVVIPADLATTLSVARLELSNIPLFPIASVEALETLHDKWRFHLLLTKLGVQVPPTELLDVHMLGQLTESSEDWLRQRIAPVLQVMDTPVLPAN